MNKLISAESLLLSVRDDPEIDGKHFARFKEHINHAPDTVKHGRWLKLSPWNNHTQSCLCLNCDSISYQKKSGVYIGKIPNYCPNCGARMDGENDV